MLVTFENEIVNYVNTSILVHKDTIKIIRSSRIKWNRFTICSTHYYESNRIFDLFDKSVITDNIVNYVVIGGQTTCKKEKEVLLYIPIALHHVDIAKETSILSKDKETNNNILRDIDIYGRCSAAEYHGNPLFLHALKERDMFKMSDIVVPIHKDAVTHLYKQNIYLKVLRMNRKKLIDSFTASTITNTFKVAI